MYTFCGVSYAVEVWGDGGYSIAVHGKRITEIYQKLGSALTDFWSQTRYSYRQDSDSWVILDFGKETGYHYLDEDAVKVRMNDLNHEYDSHKRKALNIK